MRAEASMVNGPRSRPRIEFEIFSPATEAEVVAGTVTRAKARCLCCGAVLAPERVRAQLAAQKGGADVAFAADGARIGGARLLAVVTLKPGESGRHYRLPIPADYAAVREAETRLKALLDAWERGGRQGLCPVPDEPTPTGGGSGAGRAFSVQRYGMLHWGDLFTARQKLALATLVQLIFAHRSDSERGVVAMALGRCAEQSSSLVRWRNSVEAVAGTYGRQALPMMWDFAEIAPIGDAASNFSAAIEWVAEVTEAGSQAGSGQIQTVDAGSHPLPDDSANVWFTDPPYYDAVPYADLSDFFYVWLKRALPNHPLLRDLLTPKQQEAVQDETKRDGDRPKNRAWFEQKMAAAFAEGRRITREDGVGCVVFAHKTTEGWEALLSGMIEGGWTITGSWPLATERPGRLRSQDSAALATSVHLIVRPRPENAGTGDWAEVLRELPERVSDWMERLQNDGIRGADLVFACIGPALEIFSRFARVETAEGAEITLPKYLEKVWEVVGRAALARVLGTAESTAGNGALGVLEADARLTALFLWTVQSADGHGTARAENERDEAESDFEDKAAPRARGNGEKLGFDVVRRFAQPLGIDLAQWEGRIVETTKGVVRLLPVTERARQLFGSEGAEGVATRIEREAHAANTVQGVLFPELGARPASTVLRKRRPSTLKTSAAALQPDHAATTLDRLHAAMLLQASGASVALRALIRTEQERGGALIRLANALTALYPSASEEKRLLDAMLLAVPR